MIGSSNSKRMSTPFFEAERELVDESPEVANQLRIYQVGYVTEAEKEIIKALGLSGIVVQTGHLSENQCAQYFIDADIFLAIDADVKNNYFFPSKLLKYFSYQRPILGLVTENSVMSRELIQSGHIALPVNNTSAIKEYIYKALIDYSSLCSFNKDYRKRFYPAAVVNEFITYLNRIVFN